MGKEGVLRNSVAKGSIELKEAVQSGGLLGTNWALGTIEDNITMMKVKTGEMVFGLSLIHIYRHWKIYSRNLISPPNFFGEHGHIEDSLVVDGCSVDGTVKHSILSTEAQVREGAVVEDAVVMSNAIIGKGCLLYTSRCV